MLFILRLLTIIALGTATPVAAAECLPPACTAFPADAGALNVRDFGAKGDGITDDTAAINAALTASGADTGPAFWHDRIVYLPDGIYLISSPIIKRYKEGRFGSGSILIGQSREGTVLRLKDNAEGYGDPSNPKPVIFTTAKLLDRNATGGGKDYNNKGEGNDAYMNYVENMTIDVGAGNAGAVGIDYLANNQGAVRNVTVRAAEGSGATGIAMTRKWPGPALLQNVTVQGFDVGIDVDNSEYGVTLEAITLNNQRQVGLRNNHNMVSVHGLTISGAPLAIENRSPDGLIAISGASITAVEAIRNAGYLTLHKVMKNGGQSESLDGVYKGSEKQPATKNAWILPVKSPPSPPADAPDTWASIGTFGAVANSGNDSTTAIRKAFASGASTVYFPHGTYHISDNIIVPASVKRIVGMTSTIAAHPERQPSFHRDQGMFRVSDSLIVEKLAFDHSYLGDQVAVEAGKGTVVLRDVIGAGVTTLLRPETGGEAFLENTCCGTLSLAGKSGVWARQLDTEGPTVRITNNGAPLWVLGLKAEQNCTILDNSNGARSEIFGGLVYITGTTANPAIPAFRNRDAAISLSYVEESFHPGSTYRIHLEDTRKGVTRTVTADQLPQRTIGRIVPELTSQ